MSTFTHWLSYNTERIFLSCQPRAYKPLTLDVALNETFSFQACFRLPDSVECQKITAELETPDGLKGRIRRVGHVPVRHRNTEMTDAQPLDIENGGPIPGYVPDVLFEENETNIPGGETHTFWCTITPTKQATPGEKRVLVRLVPENGTPVEMTAKINVHALTLKPRKNFSITHWFYADSILEWYHVKPFENDFWPLLEAYVKNYVAHGLDTLYVPVFTPPLDGIKRPTQLLKVTKLGKDKWSFDWTDVKRWIATAQKCGIKNFEWVHLFSQWGVKLALRIYEGQGETEKLLWPVDTPALSPIYKKFLKQYLNELHDLLMEMKLVDKSFFHVSDEPHGQEASDNYGRARKMLKEIAPWMKTMDALSDIEIGRAHVTDMPIPSETIAPQFIEEGIDCWCYYCCGPRGQYLNRLLDTPLPKIAMHGLLFYRWPFEGFLHWGFNYWFKRETRTIIDVFADQDGLAWPLWTYGDTCQVYPGEEGPIDSIRWEVFSESLQDYRLLQTLAIPRNDKVLKDIKSFADFPKDPTWRQKLRRKLLADSDK